MSQPTNARLLLPGGAVLELSGESEEPVRLCHVSMMFRRGSVRRS